MDTKTLLSPSKLYKNRLNGNNTFLRTIGTIVCRENIQNTVTDDRNQDVQLRYKYRPLVSTL